MVSFNQTPLDLLIFQRNMAYILIVALKYGKGISTHNVIVGRIFPGVLEAPASRRQKWLYGRSWSFIQDHIVPKLFMQVSYQPTLHLKCLSILMSAFTQHHDSFPCQYRIKYFQITILIARDVIVIDQVNLVSNFSDMLFLLQHFPEYGDI